MPVTQKDVRRAVAALLRDERLPDTFAAFDAHRPELIRALLDAAARVECPSADPRAYTALLGPLVTGHAVGKTELARRFGVTTDHLSRLVRGLAARMADVLVLPDDGTPAAGPTAAVDMEELALVTRSWRAMFSPDAELRCTPPGQPGRTQADRAYDVRRARRLRAAVRLIGVMQTKGIGATAGELAAATPPWVDIDGYARRRLLSAAELERLASTADSRWEARDPTLQRDLHTALLTVTQPGAVCDPDAHVVLLEVLSRFWMEQERVQVFALSAEVRARAGELHHATVLTFARMASVAAKHGAWDVGRRVVERGLDVLRRADLNESERTTRRMELFAHLSTILMYEAAASGSSAAYAAARDTVDRAFADWEQVRRLHPHWHAVLWQRHVNLDLLDAASTRRSGRKRRVSVASEEAFVHGEAANDGVPGVSSWPMSWDLTAANVYALAGERDMVVQSARRFVTRLVRAPFFNGQADEYRSFVRAVTEPHRGRRTLLTPEELPALPDVPLPRVAGAAGETRFGLSVVLRDAARLSA